MLERRVVQPDAITVQDLGDRLLITRRWFYWTSIPIGLFALVWIGVTLARFAHHLLNVCSCFFLSLGLLALCVSILSVANRTEIEVDQSRLTIQHGPLPGMSKIRAVPTRDIRELLVKSIWISGNIAAGGHNWELHSVDQWAQSTALLRALPDWNQAEFIRQELERFLQRVRTGDVQAVKVANRSSGRDPAAG